MSVSSVGGLFGYVDPATVAGPGRASQPVASTSDSSDTAPLGATTVQGASASSSAAPFPSVAPAGSLSSGGAQFAPATASALIKVQEAAVGSTP
jgi:hypothetical protein